MDPDEFAKKAAKFFPKAKDWPPLERRQVVTPEEMVRGTKLEISSTPNPPIESTKK